MSREDHATFGQARDAIEHGSDRDLAVRLILVSLCESEDDAAVRLLTNEKARIGPPSLALVDGAPARLIKEAKLERGLGQFLRETVPLTAAWLGPRVAEMSRHHREQVGDLRSLLAGGQLPGVLGQQFPALVVQEALRRKGAARDRLLADLVAPWNAPPPPAPMPKPGETIDKCGLAMNLLTPLGLRFADAFTKPAPFGGSEEDA
ncbi:MAG TPA: hypothetical protein VFN38_04995 [Gemmatimonadaceae bacterium]|nr:hypothetical protein [Gemmatimonadaceae bacterium]